MKIILTQEVTGLGQPGDVVEVKDGYGRNYLLPRGVAITWTRGGEKTVDSIKKARASRAVRDQQHADDIKGKLEAAPVDLKVKAGAAGRLFGAVTPTEIAGAIAAVVGHDVDRRSIALGNPIKTLGSHSVSVRLHDEVSATVALNVIPA
jgi:large subunit ribosomal protein L9